jgi:8-oxo-dGTP pyrophosphatase MutT (NUDIX family)
MAEILLPRPAATVLTVRDGTNGYEILMLRRNLNSDFVGGAYVFPGGRVDESDAGPVAEGLSFGLSDIEASRRLALDSGGLAYYIACLRELFEEAGLLVVCTRDGESIPLNDEETIRRLAASRRDVNAGALDFLTMLEREEMVLDLRGLEYLAHWVTPIGPPRRFDTRFFVLEAPADQIATHDAGETVADQWIRPLDALAAHERGELEMILPTIRNLEAIAHLSSARDVVAHAKSLRDVVRVEPRIVTSDGEVRILMPDDDDYDD